MGKYQLVASHYDQYRNEFLNEVVINIPGMDLTTLPNIDNFTSSKVMTEIMKIISECNNITNQNLLSIRYFKNQTSNPIYYKVIYDNSMINQMSSSVGEKTIGTKQHSKAPAVAMNEDFYLEFKTIEKMLEERNIDLLIETMGENHPLVHYARNYISTESNDYFGLNECMKLLKNEFSRYKTFRGWIVAKNKPIKKRVKQSITTSSIKKEKIVSKSVEEYEAEYEKNNPNYEQRILNDYNLRDLDEDKEEFIEEDELKQMGYHK